MPIGITVALHFSWFHLHICILLQTYCHSFSIYHHITVCEIQMLFCCVSSTGECLQCCFFLYSWWTLLCESSFCYFFTRPRVLHPVYCYKVTTNNTGYSESPKNFSKRTGLVYAFLGMLQEHFRNTVVISFPGASAWELGLSELQKGKYVASCCTLFCICAV